MIAAAGQRRALARAHRAPRAKAEGRVLVVYAGATWCEPCKRFKAPMQTGRLDDKLAKTTLLVFDADRDTDRLARGGLHVPVHPVRGLPGADGHPTDTQRRARRAASRGAS